MLYPELTPQFCRQLKADGFPQPELAPFQYWYSLLDVPFVVVGQIIATGDWKVQNLNTGNFDFIEEVTEEMLFAPRIHEAFNFKHKRHERSS